MRDFYMPDSLHATHLRNDLYCVESDVKLYYTIPCHPMNGVKELYTTQMQVIGISAVFFLT